MKKFFMIAAVVAACAAFTSCGGSDAQKAAKLTKEAAELLKSGDYEGAQAKADEADKIIDAHENDADFRAEYLKALQD